ncbi:hypothetical protein IFR04_012738 [Cadophora malorum]|uniref:Uncharacterized protein n=1 Tax=Cadophora malorum TaxID=108018 RepID=A0A8H7W3T3_9HELO|nr:hypothetical protein IFR04_012738 [Cadophora malorum]
MKFRSKKKEKKATESETMKNVKEQFGDPHSVNVVQETTYGIEATPGSLKTKVGVAKKTQTTYNFCGKKRCTSHEKPHSSAGLRRRSSEYSLGANHLHSSDSEDSQDERGQSSRYRRKPSAQPLVRDDLQAVNSTNQSSSLWAIAVKTN